MGRRRNKQNQTARIYHRERDHREIIMDDSYHGAMYLSEQVEPIWRRYKPRLVVGSVFTSNKSENSMHLVSVDVENKYFTMLTYSRRLQDSERRTLISFPATPQYIYNKDLIWIYYTDITDADRGGSGGYGVISKNGYDWKLLKFYPFPPGVHNYGMGYRIFGDGYYIFADQYPLNVYSVYKLIYQEGENIGTIEYLGDIPDDYTKGNYIAPINTSQYSGYVSYRTTTTSVRRSGTYYYTWKYDLYIYDYLSNSYVNIYHKDGPSNVEHSQQFYVDKMNEVQAAYYINDKIFFIECWWIRSQITGMETRRLVCVYSPISNINLNSWNEVDFFSWTYSPTSSSSSEYYNNAYYFITIKNNTAYLYMQKHCADGSFSWVLFKSSNLDDWEEISLPDYLDVPYFNEDNSDNRYGVVVNSQYDYVRIPISSNALNNVPSNIILATDDIDKIFGQNMGYEGNGASASYKMRADNLWFEILDGKVTTDIATEDLWLFDVCPNTIIYIDNMTFSNSSNNCAYAIYEPKHILDGEYSGYDIIPYKETIDESDYIFNR